jgi:transmembrane sensor
MSAVQEPTDEPTKEPNDKPPDEVSEEADTLRRQAKDWVVHVATGELTSGDLNALARWQAQSPRHAQAYAQALQLWHALGAPLQEAASIRASTPAARTAGRLLGRRAFLGGALAATAAATGVMIVHPPLDLWPSLAALAADYRTGVGEQRRITLTDQASIEMNTRTSLNIPGSASNTDSIELIAGEAAVVAGPEPLVVLAAQGRMAARDAQFTVRYDGADVQVTSLGGFVDVEYRGRNVTVQPREQVAYAGGRILPMTAIDPEVVAGWREGLLVFEDERLSRVIEEVNRYRAGRIILVNAALGERRVTARFKLARLDAVLTQFQEVFGAKVTPLAGGFVLLS